MSVIINYKNIPQNKPTNLIIFVDEHYNFYSLKKVVSNKEHLFISDLIKTKNKKDKIISLDINSKKNYFSIIKKRFQII